MAAGVSDKKTGFWKTNCRTPEIRVQVENALAAVPDLHINAKVNVVTRFDCLMFRFGDGLCRSAGEVKTPWAWAADGVFWD